MLLLAALPVPAQETEPGIVITETGDSTIVYESSYQTTNPPVDPKTDRLQVSLATQPSGNVVINVVSSDTAQVTVSPAQLTFTSSNWQTAQSVTLTAVNDAVREELVTNVAIRFTVDATSADTTYRQLEEATHLVSVVDNEDTAIIVTQTDGSTHVGEAAGERTDRFDVVLGRRPLRDVTVAVTVPSDSSADISVLPTSLTFRPTSWNVPQTVTVTAIDDNIAEGTEIKTIQVGVDTSLASGVPVSSPEYLGVESRTVTVTVTDDDATAFEVVQSGGSTVTSEADVTPATNDVDGKDSFTLRLAREPQGNVRVQIRSEDTSEVRIRTGTAAFGETVTLTFEPDDWDDVRTIDVQGVDDDDHDGHQDVAVRISILQEGTHPVWRDLEDHVVMVRNLDDEKSVMVRPTEMELAEGESDTYTISLTRQPSASVTVEMDPQGVSLDKQQVVFTTTNWQTAQVVQVRAVDDDVRTGDRQATVNHTIVSQDSEYNDDARAAAVSISIEEDELFDVAAANRALQETVRVDHRGEDNVVTWDMDVVDGDAVGVQVWRASSPFRIITTIDEDATGFAAQRFIDLDRDAGDYYIVTVFFGPSEAEGRFPPTASLDRVPGYMGMSQSELEGLAASAGGSGLSSGAIAAIGILAVVVLIVIIVIVVLVARRAPKDEPEEHDERAQSWKQAGWHVEPRSHWEAEKRSEPERPDDAWEPVDEGERAAQTFHLTCPRCGHAFTATGQKPLTTTCPNCGVEGVLR